QHQSVQAVQDGAAEGLLGDYGKDDGAAAGRLDGRHVAVPDEDCGLALAPALASPRVEIRRDPDDRLPHGAGDGSASSLAPVSGFLRRDACEAEFFLPAQMVRRHDAVALDRRVPDRIRGSLVEARQDITQPAHDSPKNCYRSLPFRSYCASARKTSALTARRTAGEILASARRRDGPFFIESQNSSGLLKTHPTVMRSVHTWRKPAARSACSMAPALPKRKKS